MKEQFNRLALGYLFHRSVEERTHAGYGTCWTYESTQRCLHGKFGTPLVGMNPGWWLEYKRSSGDKIDSSVDSLFGELKKFISGNQRDHLTEVMISKEKHPNSRSMYIPTFGVKEDSVDIVLAYQAMHHIFTYLPRHKSTINESSFEESLEMLKVGGETETWLRQLCSYMVSNFKVYSNCPRRQEPTNSL